MAVRRHVYSEYNSYCCMQKAISSSGVQRDCIRLSRYITAYLSDRRKEELYCTDNPNNGNYICKTDACNTAFTLTATRSLVFVPAAIAMTSSLYYTLWRP